MIDQDEISEQSLLLHDGDFPPHYRAMLHPHDLQIYKGEMPDEPIEYVHPNSNDINRLICRIPIHLDANHWTKASFVIDTGCSVSFMFGPPLLALMRDWNKIKHDDNFSYIKTTFGCMPSGKYRVDPTPDKHHNANIIGLRTMIKLGFSIDEERMVFMKNPTFL